MARPWTFCRLVVILAMLLMVVVGLGFRFLIRQDDNWVQPKWGVRSNAGGETSVSSQLGGAFVGGRLRGIHSAMVKRKFRVRRIKNSRKEILFEQLLTCEDARRPLFQMKCGANTMARTISPFYYVVIV